MGYYNAEQTTIYINKNYPGDFRRLVAHEIVHVIFEPFIKKYKIGHQRKENLANALLEVLKPN